MGVIYPPPRPAVFSPLHQNCLEIFGTLPWLFLDIIGYKTGTPKVFSPFLWKNKGHPRWRKLVSSVTRSGYACHRWNKKAQLSLTNPRDAKASQNCFNSTCLQRCRWQYWPIFMRLTAIASEIREIPRNSLKIQTYGVQGHPRSSILVPIESPYVTSY